MSFLFGEQSFVEGVPEKLSGDGTGLYKSLPIPRSELCFSMNVVVSPHEYAVSGTASRLRRSVLVSRRQPKRRCLCDFRGIRCVASSWCVSLMNAMCSLGSSLSFAFGSFFCEPGSSHTRR